MQRPQKFSAMKKLSTISLFYMSCLFFIGTAVQAQIEISPSPTETSVHPAAFEGVGYSFVTNNGPAGDFVWVRNIISMTDGWGCAVCDVNICHGESVSTMPFSLAAGESGTLDVHAYPYGNAGSAIVEVTVTSLDNPEIIATGLYLFNETVSVPELLIEHVKIWPNPATDHLFVENGHEVSRLELYNISGQQVINQPLNADRMVNLNNLPSGAYVARLFDNQNAQISANKIVIK